MCFSVGLSQCYHISDGGFASIFSPPDPCAELLIIVTPVQALVICDSEDSDIHHFLKLADLLAAW